MSSPSIITVLKKDHKEVSALLKQAIAASAESKRDALFGRINEALTTHTAFEEESIYPVLAEKKKTREDTLEAFEEHGQIKHLLREIASTSCQDERWKAKMMVLAEDVKHHVHEEEQAGGLFDDLESALAEEDLQVLAKEYESFKSGSAR